MGEAIMGNVGTFGVDVNGEATSGLNHEGESTEATPRDGASCSSDEVRESEWSEGVRVVKLSQLGQPEMGGVQGLSKTILYFSMGSLGSLSKGEEQKGSSRT